MIEIRPLASSSKGNAYIVTDSITPLLLECGLPIKELRRRAGFGLTDLAGCLVSHGHADHCKALDDLAKAGVDIYTSAETEAKFPAHHRIKIIAPLQQFKIGSWTILPFPTEHDCPGSLGFLLANNAGDKLLFATDTYYVRYKFNGLTHILVEANYADDILQHNVESGAVPGAMKQRLLKSHFSLANVKAFLKANDLSMVQEIHLIHLSDGNSDAARFKLEVQSLTGKPVYVADK